MTAKKYKKLTLEEADVLFAIGVLPEAFEEGEWRRWSSSPIAICPSRWYMEYKRIAPRLRVEVEE